MKKEQKSQKTTKPMFLKSVAKPVEARKEMAKAKLPKMCDSWTYGN